MGNNRLAIMDIEGGAQPYRLADVTVVFNGELYNHEELRASLSRRGFTFPDRCDGSILPALYMVYGDGFAEHLDGMYSVAVMDMRSEPRLILATDESGMKPLYYHWDAATGNFHFASEIPALLGFQGVPAEELDTGLHAYLTSKTPFGEQTMLAGIRVMPPRSTTVVTRAQGVKIRQRQNGATGSSAVNRGGQELKIVARDLQEALRSEVHRLLVADVPVAAITSGGLDSSLVTALAAEAAPDLHTFNIAYTGSWPGDERAYASEVAEFVGTKHHQVEIDPATFPDLLQDVVWHLGQPNADPITLSTFSLFRAVREQGFKVALTGDAADELFGGYGRMTKAVAAGPGHAWLGEYLDGLAVAPAALRDRLYTDEYAMTVRESEPPIPQRALDELMSGSGSRLERISAFERDLRLPSYHLRRVDHLSMASSVEVRLPFCQPRIVRFAAGLSDEQKITPAGVKRALYAAADGLLPTSVLTRSKQPFTLPITAMLRPGSALWDLARDSLSETTLRNDGRLRPEAVRGLFDTQSSHPTDTSALTLWALMTHQLWRHQFLARSHSAPALQQVAA